MLCSIIVRGRAGNSAPAARIAAVSLPVLLAPDVRGATLARQHSDLFGPAARVSKILLLFLVCVVDMDCQDRLRIVT